MSARRGSAALANDWQWLIGFPALAALLWFFRAYLNDDTQQLLSGATAFSTLMAALAAFLITMFASFFGRLFIAPATLFYQERTRADAAEQRLVPCIRVFLDPDCAGVRVVGTRTGQPPNDRRGPNTKWVQIMVQSATEAPLVDCEARLLRVDRVNNGTTNPILTEPIFCGWSKMAGQEQQRLTIPARIPQAANLVWVEEGNSHLNIATTHISYDLKEEIQHPGKYRLSLAVSAKDCLTELIAVILEWGGSYDNIKINKE